MPFPFSRRDEISLPLTVASLSDADVIARLSTAIASHAAARVDAAEDTLHFQVPLSWMMSKWDILAYVDRGTLSLVRRGGERRLAYAISLKRSVAIGTALVVGVFGILAFVFTDPIRAVCLVVGMWLLLVGSVYPLTVLRFPRFLRRTLAQASAMRSR